MSEVSVNEEVISEPVERPFIPVLMVIGGLVPVKYDEDLYKIYKDDVYRSPEIKAGSWEQLCKLVALYFGVKYHRNVQLDELDEGDRLLVEILGARIDWTHFCPRKIPPIPTFEMFQKIVKEFRMVHMTHG